MHQHLFLKLAHKAASFPHFFPLSTPLLSLFLCFSLTLPFFSSILSQRLFGVDMTMNGDCSRVNESAGRFHCLCVTHFLHTLQLTTILTIDLSVDCFFYFLNHWLIRYSASWPLLSSSSYATCCVQKWFVIKRLQYKVISEFESSRTVEKYWSLKTVKGFFFFLAKTHLLLWPYWP